MYLIMNAYPRREPVDLPGLKVAVVELTPESLGEILNRVATVNPFGYAIQGMKGVVFSSTARWYRGHDEEDDKTPADLAGELNDNGYAVHEGDLPDFGKEVVVDDNRLTIAIGIGHDLVWSCRCDDNECDYEAIGIESRALGTLALVLLKRIMTN